MGLLPQLRVAPPQREVQTALPALPLLHVLLGLRLNEPGGIELESHLYEAPSSLPGSLRDPQRHRIPGQQVIDDGVLVPLLIVPDD